MQELRLINPEEQDTKFLFMLELLNLYTKRLNIGNRLFYIRVNRELQKNEFFSNMSLNRRGIVSFEQVFETFRRARGDGEIYAVAPLFSSMSWVIAHVYQQASHVIGEKCAKSVLKDSYEIVAGTYGPGPDFRGYLPHESVGFSNNLESSSAFSVSLVSNILDYLVFIIRKRAEPEDLGGVLEKTQSREEAVSKIKTLYTEILGPLGVKQLLKLRKISNDTTLKQIDYFRDMHILNKAESEQLKNGIIQIFKIPLEAEK